MYTVKYLQHPCYTVLKRSLTFTAIFSYKLYKVRVYQYKRKYGVRNMLGKGERMGHFQKGQEVAYSDILDRLRKMMKRILGETVLVYV